MPNPPLQFEEVSPEIIGNVENGQVQLDPHAIAPEEPETPPAPAEVPETPEEETPELEDLRANLTKQIDTLIETIKAVDQGEHQEITKMKESSMERDEAEKTSQEERKKLDKETLGQHKGELKAKDQEIKELKKVIQQKEKEVAKLHKQVKEALYDGEES